MSNKTAAVKIGMTVRLCSHCGRPLTDAVSLSVGVGPVCRGIENHLYATTIPANVAEAFIAYRAIDTSRAAPETLETLETVGAELLLADAGDAEVTDWRATVKRLDYCLSFAASQSKVRAPMIAVIRNLGYVGLAALIEGRASVSPATVKVEAGRILVEGCVNHHAGHAFKKIAGYVVSADKKFWSFPASVANAETLRELIPVFYPVSVVDWPTILSAAQAASLAAVAVETVQKAAPSKPPIHVTAIGTRFAIPTPYFQPAFVAFVKALPYSDRVFREKPATYFAELPEGFPPAWIIDAKHLDAVVAKAEAVFKTKVAVPVTASVAGAAALAGAVSMVA